LGANPIIVVDLDDEKLKFAKQFGATHVVNASREDPVQAIRKLTQRNNEWDLLRQPIKGVDYSFDCIGLTKTMEQMVSSARPGNLGGSRGGWAVLLGRPWGSQPQFNLFEDFHIREKRFVGSMGGSSVPDRDFPILLKWFKNGQLDLNALVTKRYKIEQINEAVAELEKGLIKGRAILEF
jgi:Zn-dependent alcohol dehydrogenase